MPRNKHRPSQFDWNASPTVARLKILLDSVLILGIGLFFEAVHFSVQQGRSVICADSMQYVAAAEAMLYGTTQPHFEMRKPGYPLFLALVAMALGNMGWAAVAANHLLIAALPLNAYGWGRLLHSRLLGYAAAFTTMAGLNDAVLANRILAESLFAFLVSFALLAFAMGWAPGRTNLHATSDPPSTSGSCCHWAILCGGLLGLAWITRGNAVAVILPCIGAILIGAIRRRPGSRARAAAFLLPIAACVVFECGLNRELSGRFRPADGTAGAMLVQRVRCIQNVPFVAGPAASRVNDLLPERASRDAYAAHELDVWFARHRALHRVGLTEWEYDDLMARAALEAIMARPSDYLRSAAHMGLLHLCRIRDGAGLSRVPPDHRQALLSPVDPDPRFHPIDQWYAYVGMPELTRAESFALVERMNRAAAERAPFGDSPRWAAVRYYLAMQPFAAALDIFSRIGQLWPGIGLIMLIAVSGRRALGLWLAAVYLCDAGLIGLLATTTDRFQFAWIAIDGTLSVGILVVPSVAAVRWLRAQARSRTAGGLISPPLSY